ncbi:uncharacterized protein K452DRAFT_293052 [Aplosporella prunicola CBS 121167]|uniref:FAD-binding PCMH-type domain-containing protein n=1 Tax=Aplosporella prunicola CBS 121167 TaxID=1176127 RepID=A0A6A6AXF1_9PEZI|nr:uncharacterized protein K452DRAFT_293052 [Aplosporella prunicola CBS 121167]KAF2135655.1 hypothetical protein K452DRAFT_293052 [Aplosporella prunicola CBS 121167]
MFFPLALLVLAHQVASNQTCRCIPGDACWPSGYEWARFNASIGGKLVASQQLASVCHDPTYDAAQCNYMRQNWIQPWLHDASSSSIMAAAVANESCDAFTPRAQPCVAGSTVAYAVKASDASDIAQTISFARSKNVRLVVRNTGHDYMGKSTGAGALAVWTHHMKKTEAVWYNSTHYSGRAIRLGAGVQVEEAYEAAGRARAVVVGGDCDTVGVTGGYLQGGGHSALSSLHGMAADAILEWEVVDGRGRLLTATRHHHRDLYWALSGGGGGTYGVAVSVVVKAHADTPVAGAQLRFGSVDAPAFDAAVAKYHDHLLPALTAANGTAIAQITSSTFLLSPLTLPGATNGTAHTLLTPLLNHLDAANIPYDLNLTHSASWIDHWRRLIKPNPTQRVQNAQYGGWLVPRDVHPADLRRQVRTITDAGCVFVAIALDASRNHAENAVLPAWRTAAMNVILSTPWPLAADLAQMKARADLMTKTCVPALARLAPDAGAYLNEADPNQPDWKRAFYGANYDRLLRVKRAYDPHDVFYAHTAVGSDAYHLDADGRLCRSL